MSPAPRSQSLAPQQARSRESLRKLLKAAAEVLGQHGLDGATIPRIAAHAGLTPGAIYRRSLAYYNLVNSPATLINADDLENFWKCHQGLASDGGDWVSFGRHHGHDIEKDGTVETAPNCGTSEAPMRNQMKAWAQYMRA